MSRHVRVAFGAALWCLSVVVRPAVAQPPPPTFVVDPLAAPSATTFNSLRAALAAHSAQFPNALQSIAVRGRFLPSGALRRYDDSVEAWTTSVPSAIGVPNNVDIFWDAANSDVDALGRRAPAVFTGALPSGAVVPVGFVLQPGAPHTRATTLMRRLEIVAFGTGVRWRPTFTGVVGATFDQLRFNQTNIGVDFQPATGGVVMDALTTGCKFGNQPQLGWVGGGRVGGLTNLQDHIRYFIDNGATIDGDVTGCTFTGDTTDPASGAPVFVLNGIFIEISMQGTMRPTISENDFLGNADVALPGPNGMLYGVFIDVLGRPTDATLLVSKCWFERCGFDGTMIYAGLQGEGAWEDMSEEWWEEPFWWLSGVPWFPGFPMPQFLFPTIADCTYLTNGTLAPLFSSLPEDGHGISTRTYHFGQLALKVTSCDVAGVSGVAPGRANQGIRGNARDGVYVSSDWFLPMTGNDYAFGAMRDTRNNTWVDMSEIYENGRHGVEVLLVDGSGNPGVKGNRIHDNASSGVDFTSMSTVNLAPPPGFPPTGPARTQVSSVNDALARDIVVAQPFAWNNFVYDLPGSFFQQVGIDEFTRSRVLFGNAEPRPDVRSDTGIIHNSVVNQIVAGIRAQDVGNRASPPWVDTVVFGNVSKFNPSLAVPIDIVVLNGVPVIAFNCNASVVGPNGNANFDPLFGGWATGDLAIPLVSPCVNAVTAPPSIGMLLDDFDLQPRPNFGGTGPFSNNDMGADEWWP